MEIQEDNNINISKNKYGLKKKKKISMLSVTLQSKISRALG
jgi:hypothetical protein